MKSMLKKLDLTGKQFGVFKVIKNVEEQQNHTRWLCKCVCGKEKILFTNNLKTCSYLSCRCGNKEINQKDNNQRKLEKHGASTTREYRCWIEMRARCNNKTHRAYDAYGGRGITVCNRWEKFGNFLEDMGSVQENKSLDRIDNNQGYFKENCRWADQNAQCNNRRNNVFMTVGCCRLTIAQWANELSMNHSLILTRLKKGWEPERIISTPAKVYRRKKLYQ